MSKREICDVCERYTPHVNVKYSRKRRWAWFLWFYDSMGGGEWRMDVCTSCWEKFEEFCKKETKK
jgi:hypothetical protein